MEKKKKNIDELTPDQYFEYVKSRKQTADLLELKEFRENATYLLEKYRITNQIAGMKKLMFIIDTIEKEEDAVKSGVDKFVYKQDIEDFIKNVSSKTVKIIELENYPREIPDDVIEKYQVVKDVFDKFYVVFTDYTGEVERQVEKNRRDKDPILFGAFHNKEEQVLSEKFYYIGDWIDEYCDLTLEKMVGEMREVSKKDIEQPVYIPSSLDEIREELDKYVYERGEYVRREKLQAANLNITNKSGRILDKVRSWFKK